MPLEDLITLGYDVFRPDPDLLPPTGPSVHGHDRLWNLRPGQDEEEIVVAATNHANIMNKLEQMQQTFSDNYKNWPSMTAQQKDAANRNAQRGLANLTRHARNDLATEGD